MFMTNLDTKLNCLIKESEEFQHLRHFYKEEGRKFANNKGAKTTFINVFTEYYHKWQKYMCTTLDVTLYEPTSRVVVHHSTTVWSFLATVSTMMKKYDQKFNSLHFVKNNIPSTERIWEVKTLGNFVKGFLCFMKIFAKRYIVLSMRFDCS
jgi:hypothetical protein